jgi:4-carboxymuconolactone decarboxylase
MHNGRESLDLFKQISGTETDLSPVLAGFPKEAKRLYLEQVFGMLLSRPGLSQKDRQLSAVAMVASLGNSPEQLRLHIDGMLNTGWMPNEVVGAILHLLVYGSNPLAQAGIAVAREVFRARGLLPVKAATDGSQRDRYKEGIRILRELAGTNGDYAVQMYRDIAPDVTRFAIEYGMGEIWARPGLTLRQKEIVTISSLAVQGNNEGPLRFHTRAAIRVGLKPSEVREIALQTAAFAGWPLAMGALWAVEQGIEDEGRPHEGDKAPSNLPPLLEPESDEARFERGSRIFGKVTKGAPSDAILKSFEDIAPELGHYIIEFGYGDVFARQGIDLKYRELAAVAAMAASDRAATQTPLEIHIAGALNVGASEQEILDVLIHLIPFVGFPKVQKAVRIVQQVFEARKQQEKK